MPRQLTHDIIYHVGSQLGLMSVFFKFAMLRFYLATSVVFEPLHIKKKKTEEIVECGVERGREA